MNDQPGKNIFDTTIHKTNQILHEIEERFGWTERRNQSYAAIRAVLHALRDRMPIHEAVHFGEQLPMLMKGFYYEGWNLSEVPRKMDKEEFVNYVQQNFQFSISQSMEEMIRGTLEVLGSHIDPNEMKKIQTQLPQELTDLVPA